MNVACLPELYRYTIVHNNDSRKVLHFNANIHSECNNHVQKISTIPVFNSLHLANRFQTHVLRTRAVRSDWNAYLDYDRNDYIVIAHASERRTDDRDALLAGIMEIDIDVEEYRTKLMMNNIGLFEIEGFWVTEDTEQLMLIGDIWTPPSCVSEEEYLTGVAKESYEKIYNGYM